MTGTDTSTCGTAETVRLPPGPPIPKALQAILTVACWRPFVARLVRRYGPAVTMHAPIFGTAVLVSDPELVKQVFLADPNELGVRIPNQITRMIGPGSMFGLNAAEHRRRRDLLSPVLHGKRLAGYEAMFVEETLAEITGWPDGASLATLEPMTRIALNATLRALYRATGAELDELRRVIPPIMKLGSRLAMLPKPARTYGRLTPWGRLARWRARYEAVVDRLIAQARTGPGLDERTDVLAVLLRGHPDGSQLSRAEIGDELLGLTLTGYEAVAAQLAWVFERISRNPQLLAELAAEATAGGNALCRATIFEVLRIRSLSGFTGRYVYAPSFSLGQWRLPRGCLVRVALQEVHRNAVAFPDPDRLEPRRFLDGGGPSPFEWIPYGGGARRCPGSAFANLQMDVVLRTVLQHFTIEPTTAPDEKWRFLGIVYVPKRGGRITVHRRAVGGTP